MIKISDVIDPDIPESEIVAIELLCKFCRREDISESKLRSVLNRIFEEDIETPAKSIDYYVDYFNNLSSEDLKLEDVRGDLYDEMVTKYENINQTRFNETYNKYKEPYCKKIEDQKQKIEDQKQKKNQKVNQQKVVVQGDIRDISSSDIPDNPDVIIGGFPCQGFSIANIDV